MNQDIEKIKGLVIKPKQYQVIFKDGAIVTTNESTIKELYKAVVKAGYIPKWGRWIDGTYSKLFASKPKQVKQQTAVINLDGVILTQIERMNSGQRRGLKTQRFGKFI